ncbi:MAG: sigma-70 family RNA polymerase sigma factor [Bacillota bacterium]|nr:sigma-70 family RNA polymerase sigma factor [Bacillota bacterium]
MAAELRLVERSKEGDLQAFEELVLMYQKQIYNLGYRMMGNEEDACDIAQEAFLRAYKSIGKFNLKSRFGTWIYRIAMNLCIDELRKRKKAKLYPIVHNDNPEDKQYKLVSDAGDLPEELVEKKETRLKVQQAINRLPEDHRTMIVLRDIQGRSYQEIADIMGLNLGTVKSRISRARYNLKEEIEKQTGTERRELRLKC